MSRRAHALRVVLAGAALLASGGAWSASFDCARASTAVEQRLCAVKALGLLDERLDASYQELLQTTPRSAVAAVREQQRAWLRQRNACAQNATPDDCLQRSLSARADALDTALAAQQQALDRIIASIPSAPAAAARQLQAYDTPLASAWLVYLHQFVPAAGVDAALSAARFQSARAALRKVDSFANSVLNDEATGPDVQEPDKTLTLLRMWIERNDSTRPYVHCFIFSTLGEPAYEAFGPLYGSTRDSFAPLCEPPGGLFALPAWTQLDAAFASLIESISKDAGTIRYASYAEWEVIALRASVSPLLYLQPALRKRYSGDPDQALAAWTGDASAWPADDRKAARALLPKVRADTAAWLVREKHLPAAQAQQVAAAIVTAWVDARLDFDS
ncbi:lysozyme inhibitor LprI family protein [Xanthomonas campestris]|uniref:lysozyme inhibitor LprI family protein n=1 Tax=Xanthomonas campestris TaxID=339 RepID=UPI00094B2393|nr:lysozyme inhibitor LprI family protein [Xanthomonas campestris]MEA0759806.1 lysozyme inhibitor LprI family protein [Xanthomonas campestris pv. campestris]MEB1221924.1 lysozyme inhibitor LprI family protein [Xanthomonas campestris pv. campestris]MEB1242601.1 lysozyme inhibitor LprI family protein [Xanthomonas campestris pv. campestris]MEB1250775.1 lysozyme inhibitor LprI family protein [Xanthomonas campestris pv. campestris]MEB1259206.1 lysozyme inhibitor LprI family protein [Xanthomonas cam